MKNKLPTKDSSLTEMINAINLECKGSLSFTHYREWEINSYKEGTPLSADNKYPFIRDRDFGKCVEKAFDFVFPEIVKEADRRIKELKRRKI